MLNRFYNQPVSAGIWILVLVTIPTVSLVGRDLQYGLEATIGTGGVRWLLGGATAGFLGLVGGLLIRRTGWIGLLHLGWILLLVAGLMVFLAEHPERWYHIPLFGLVGFLSVRLFSVRTGIEIAMTYAVLDELLQSFLPDRHGTFEDVIVNALCGVLGVAIYLLTRIEAEGSVAEDGEEFDEEPTEI